MPFLVYIYRNYMTSGGRKGADLLFLKECIFGNHKCTIFSPFSVKIYTYTYTIWGRLQGGSTPLPKKILYFAS